MPAAGLDCLDLTGWIVRLPTAIENGHKNNAMGNIDSNIRMQQSTLFRGKPCDPPSLAKMSLTADAGGLDWKVRCSDLDICCSIATIDAGDA